LGQLAVGDCRPGGSIFRALAASADYRPAQRSPMLRVRKRSQPTIADAERIFALLNGWLSL
jgi:hypothetical protein